MKTYAYLRVSTAEQNTEKNKADVLKFANDRNLGRVHFIEENVSGLKKWKNRKLAGVVDQMKAGDVLIAPELSRLGRSIVDILDVLRVLSEKDCKVFSVKENFQLNGSGIQDKVMRTMFALFAEIERDIISQRTIEGLASAKEKGAILGRPKGPGRSKLDQHRPEIIALLKNGSTKTFVAQRYGVTTATLHHWLRVHDMNRAF